MEAKQNEPRILKNGRPQGLKLEGETHNSFELSSQGLELACFFALLPGLLQRDVRWLYV
jgi:hypothetical protein